ncbi:hypothetical protein OKHIL_27970 [Mycolicibacterium mageritense]
MAPTPTPTPSPLDGLDGSNGTSPLDGILNDIASNTDPDAIPGANLDAALEAAAGVTDPSPWLAVSWAGIGVAALALIVAAVAIGVTVWKELRVGGRGNVIRLSRSQDATRNSLTRASSEQRRGGFTFTPAADTDDLPDPPVDLDLDGADR